MDKAVLPGAMSEEAIQVERLQKELRTVAALEVCTCKSFYMFEWYLQP